MKEKNKRFAKFWKWFDFVFYILGILGGLAIVCSLAVTPQRILTFLTNPADKIFFIGILFAVVKFLFEYFEWIFNKMKQLELIK